MRETASQSAGKEAEREPSRKWSFCATLDSAGLQAFAQVRRKLPEDCPVIVRSAQPRLRQVFEITGLSTAFVFE